ncbi:diacylglycerol acyltransferase-domain-containing protein [Delphinella strobiligena]|nr:diacylglycerol acyltransferase-domain-containing protein [Delphinella strobiligena]
MSLNPEPADPQDRQEQHLPPKSFAEAAVENVEAPNAHDESADTNRTQPEPGKSYAAATLDGTNGNGHTKVEVVNNGADEYSGQGMDESPRTPIVRKTHKRVSSRASQGSLNRRKSPSGDEGPPKLIYESFGNDESKQLISVKPHDAFEDLPKAEEKKKPQHERSSSRDDLVSGRRAGAGWEQSAIHWAPLNLPIKRRLQTFMVLLHTLSIASFLALFFLLCTVPLLWPILLPYLIYVLFSKASTDGTLSHRSERFRRLPIWSLFASYFPARLHRSQDLSPTRKYVFGYHPHGIISHGAFAAFGTEALGFSTLFPGITNTLLTLDANFRIPLYRDYALRMGLASVSRESCENLLSKGGHNKEGMGRAITIVVGGARESLDAQPGALRLVLARRKGFIKLAIRTGADLVPVLAFGENELYEQFDPSAHPMIHKMQLAVKKALGFTVPLFHARGVFNYDVGMMPYRRPLNIVVGRPVMVDRMERPSQEYVDEMHDKYVEELKRIWDEWKDIFAKNRDGELEIVE